MNMKQILLLLSLMIVGSIAQCSSLSPADCTAADGSQGFCCQLQTEDNICSSIQCPTDEPTTAEPTTAVPTTSEPTTQSPTTQSPTTSDPTTSAPTAPIITTTEEATTTSAVCKYWTSNRFGEAGGAPIDVCFGRFGGALQTSESYIYTCSDDKSTVEYWKYTQSTDCNVTTASKAELISTFQFDPSHPSDTFECNGDPCPYFIILDGTAHQTQTCPYDVDTDFKNDGDYYATWHLKLLLQGCQSFGTSSLLLTCSNDGGIRYLEFDNNECDENGITKNTVLTGGTIECNYGTGRAVGCNAAKTNNNDTSSGTTSTTSAISTTSATSTTIHTMPGSHAASHYNALFYIFIVFAYIMF